MQPLRRRARGESGCSAKTPRVPDFDRRLEDRKHPSRPIRSDFIPNASRTRPPAGQPKNVVMLAADAFGVLPRSQTLSPAQASVSLPVRLYRQGSRAPSAVSATSRSRNSPPASASPFLPLDPSVYGNMLREPDRQAQCRLLAGHIPAGSGGKFGYRQPDADQGHAAHADQRRSTAACATIEFRTDKYFGLSPVPTRAAGRRQPRYLNSPVNTWKDKADVRQDRP